MGRRWRKPSRILRHHSAERTVHSALTVYMQTTTDKRRKVISESAAYAPAFSLSFPVYLTLGEFIFHHPNVARVTLPLSSVTQLLRPGESRAKRSKAKAEAGEAVEEEQRTA